MQLFFLNFFNVLLLWAPQNFTCLLWLYQSVNMHMPEPLASKTPNYQQGGITAILRGFDPVFNIKLKCRFTFMAKLFPQPAYVQLKGFLPSCSPSTWHSKLKRQVNPLSHPSLEHNSFLFSPEWTRSSCWCRNQVLLKSFLHSPHGTLAIRTKLSNLNKI